MAGSASERAIRDAVCAHLRSELPKARIIHELVAGWCRADLAVVEPQRLLLIEIKSEKDVLDRLDTQMRTFEKSSHGAILVAHERWFDREPYSNGAPRIAWAHKNSGWVGCGIWAYPAPVIGHGYRWRLPNVSLRQPRAYDFLSLLWRDELIAEAARHRIAVPRRARVSDIVDLMSWMMTGREIAQAVCRQLRARAFPEADAPITDYLEAAE